MPFIGRAGIFGCGGEFFKQCVCAEVRASLSQAQGQNAGTMKGRLFHHITIISTPGSNLPTLLFSMSRLVPLNPRPLHDTRKSHLTKRQVCCLFSLFPLIFLSPSLLFVYFSLPPCLPFLFFFLCMDMFLPEYIHSFNLTIGRLDWIGARELKHGNKYVHAQICKVT